MVAYLLCITSCDAAFLLSSILYVLAIEQASLASWALCVLLEHLHFIYFLFILSQQKMWLQPLTNTYQAFIQA